MEVIFSNEKVPGEGEHACAKFVRDYGDDNESFIITGMDADLVMLSLATHKKNFCILRENSQRYRDEYFYINMREIRESLVFAMLGELPTYPEKQYINDFILMVYFVGNDFLPNIQSINISEGSVERMFSVYGEVVKSYGPMVSIENKINMKSLKLFITTLALKEVEFLVTKKPTFPDKLIEKYKSGNEFNFEAYRKEYYSTKVCCGNTEENIKNLCIKYITGLQWVLTYYLKGCDDWRWFYPYSYAPLLSDLAKYIDCYNYVPFLKSKPFSPFMQLLCVLPQKSANLLPMSMAKILLNSPSYELQIDIDGKHQAYEGIVIGLPTIDFQDLETKYIKALENLDNREKHRNILGKIYKYIHTEKETTVLGTFKSRFGDIENCTVSKTFL
jgi:5'-3' exoribonuclease 2